MGFFCFSGEIQRGRETRRQITQNDRYSKIRLCRYNSTLSKEVRLKRRQDASFCIALKMNENIYFLKIFSENKRKPIDNYRLVL